MPDTEVAGNSAPNSHLIQHRFKPGQSGNPSGRPKALFGPALRQQLEADPKLLHKVAKALLRKACKGDVRAFDSAADRVDGPVPKSLNVEDFGGITINIRHIGIGVQTGEPKPTNGKVYRLEDGK